MIKNGRRFNLPFKPKEKEKALNLLKNSTLEFVARKYHVSINTVYLWRKKYDGTLESLENKSHRPHSPHPNSQTATEKKHIDDIVRRNPRAGLNELYGKLRTNYNYKRHPTTLYKYLLGKGFYDKKNIRYKKYVPKPYDTPEQIGVKWQLDVKYVPKNCFTKNIVDDERFYQYTVIDECTRERFIYPYKEINGNVTVDFIKRAIAYFGYKPLQIQTDNGSEFTYTQMVKNKRKHSFDVFCDDNNILHTTIRPRTPRHNGKVERSHRNDNERFYKFLKFYSYDVLVYQMKAYLHRSNNIPISSLGWKTPIELRQAHLLSDWGVIS